MVLDGVEGADEALAVGRRLVEALRRPFRLAADSVRIGASVGVALGAAGLDSAETLRRADVAMYTAKAQGKGRVLVFGEPQQPAGHSGRSDGLPAGLAVRYLPWVDTATGATLALRALPTWAHPTDGDLESPAALERAEAEGFDGALTVWLMDEARQRAARLRASGEGAPVVSVPLGERQLLDPCTLDGVTALLQRARLVGVHVPAPVLHDDAARNAVALLAGAGALVTVEAELADPGGPALAAAVRARTVAVDLAAGSPGVDVELAGALGLVARRCGLEVVATGVDGDATAAALAALGLRVVHGGTVPRARRPEVGVS